MTPHDTIAAIEARLDEWQTQFAFTSYDIEGKMIDAVRALRSDYRERLLEHDVYFDADDEALRELALDDAALSDLHTIAAALGLEPHDD